MHHYILGVTKNASICTVPTKEPSFPVSNIFSVYSILHRYTVDETLTLFLPRCNPLLKTTFKLHTYNLAAFKGPSSLGYLSNSLPVEVNYSATTSQFGHPRVHTKLHNFPQVLASTYFPPQQKTCFFQK